MFPDWQKDVRPQLREFKETWQQAGSISNLGAADYHSKFIKPLLESLGFSLSADGKNDGSADYVLRSSGSDKGTQPIAALLVYPWDRPLDRKDDSERERAEDIPGIRVVKVLEAQKFNWAILTNGKDWRLYCSQAHSRASNYYEIDLPGMLDQDDLTAFRYFYFFFRAEAFNLQRSATGTPEAEPLCFLDRLRQGSAEFAKEVGDRLRKQIFESVFPYLAQGFVDYRKSKYGEATKAGDAFLNEVYDATLTLLYRLLFLLYAESLDLVPVNEPAYAASSLRSLKKEIGDAASGDSEVVEDRLKRRYDKSETKLYKRLGQLFDVIDGSDNELSRKFNVPAYNGGLFRTQPPASDKSREAAAARFLNQYRVPDYYLARALDLLARDEDTKSHKLVFVDYKALGVQQLGSIYEGLLMYHVVIPADEWEKGYQRRGLKVALVPSNKERKKLGSYFTPQHIVKYIVANTVGPLLAEKFDAIAPKLREAQRSYRETREFEIRRSEKMRGTPRSNDAIASGILEEFENVVWDLFDLKVLDPAMGSGHFLVETVDFITDKVLDFLAGFPWNPVHVLIELRIRRQILESLDAQGVKINEDRLTDVNLIKRLVMKRCAYGVDLNPMAVELAKVSLWLDCFTLGAPLSFLDHHLKCGNSLIGSSIAELRRTVAESGSLFAIPMEPLERATRNMELIADITDATLKEVTQSVETYSRVLSGVEGYRALLDCLTAVHFGIASAKDVVVHAEALGLRLDDWNHSISQVSQDNNSKKLAAVISESQHIGLDRRFIHWDLDFPDVFFTSRREPTQRAFDAIVGNPPYGADIVREKEYVRHMFPLIRGKINLFALFVERCLTIARANDKKIGFVIPTMICSSVQFEVLREYIVEQAGLDSLVVLNKKQFEEAYVDTCIMLTGGRPHGRMLVTNYDTPGNRSPQVLASDLSPVERSRLIGPAYAFLYRGTESNSGRLPRPRSRVIRFDERFDVTTVSRRTLEPQGSRTRPSSIRNTIRASSLERTGSHGSRVTMFYDTELFGKGGT
ncbi:MAG: N-6 DNA methylase [Planctomycetes bacterium]|nr:N-6 DNA methylase [Planctomycetota bacterium]